MLTPLFNHLWQSTLFAVVAGLLTLVLRKNHARVRHGVWLAASIKFLIPISLLISLGGAIPWRTAPQNCRGFNERGCRNGCRESTVHLPARADACFERAPGRYCWPSGCPGADLSRSVFRGTCVGAKSVP